MLNMENAEEVMQILERFTRLKQKEIPKELDDYMHYVAKTGDTVFKWSSLKYLFREKLLNVIKNFHDTSPRVDDLPQYPNVDPFNYESMKSSLLERLELFNAAPFTVQRLCELLTEPRKQYSRIDKFMRALEKNILVSTIEPGRKQTESENGDSLDSVVNGDVSLDVNVDIEMENETIFNAADTPNNAATPSENIPTQPSSNLIHKADDDILPNPKKAKLDLDENNDAETEAATKSIANSKSESAIGSMDADENNDTSVENKPAELVSEEKPVAASVEISSEEIQRDSKVCEREKMEDDASDSVPVNETKNDINSEAKEIGLKSEEEKTAIAHIVVDQTAQDASQPDIVVDSCGKLDENIEVEKLKASIEEKVSEKEENEKIELQKDELKSSEVKTETNITIIAETNIDKQSESAKEGTSDLVNKEEKPNETNTTSAVDAAAIEKDVEAKLASKVTTENKTNGGETNTVADESKNVSEEKTVAEAVVLPTKLASEGADAVSEDQKESPKTESIETEGVNKPTENTDKETESAIFETAATKAVEVVAEKKEVEVTETAPTVETATSKDIATEKEDLDKNIAEASTDVIAPSVVEIPTVVTSSNEAPITVPASDIITSDINAITTESALVKATSTVITAVGSATSDPPSSITTDQPMEENSESIAEAEPVVPAIIVEAAASVEEVVMGDSAEMATDAIIEPSKDEPAGMEVDDTSQEAMDQ